VALTSRQRYPAQVRATNLQADIFARKSEAMAASQIAGAVSVVDEVEHLPLGREESDAVL
jgi:hypothetical protein